MTQFYREYPALFSIGQPLVAQLTWAHNILLIQKTKDMETRLWYMQTTIEQGWSRNVLQLMINSNARERQGKAGSEKGAAP